MPTSAAATEIAYTGNGVTVAYPFPFEVAKAAHFEATIDGVVVTDYTLSGLGVDTGGTCTFTTAPASLAAVVLARIAPYSRSDFDYQEGGELAASTLDEDIDRAVMLSQQLATISNRSIRAPRGETMGELPAAADRASLLLGFDVTGEPTAMATATGATVSAAMIPVVTAASVDTARNLMGTEFAPPSNITLSVSASAGALTIALKGRDGADHSATNPGAVSVPSTSGAGSQIFTTLDITAAQSITIPSGATMGALAGVPFRLWVVGVSNAGAFKLGVINPLVITGNFLLTGTVSLDSTFEVCPLYAYGNTDVHAELDTAADLAATIYYVGSSGVIRPYTLLGYIDCQVVTPGTWITPVRTVNWVPGVAVPGQVVRTYGTRAAAVSSAATVLPIDDTIPQSGEGIPCMTATAAINANSSAFNLLRVRARVNLASSNTDTQMAAALFLNSDANACAATVAARPATAGVRSELALQYVGPNIDSSGTLVATVSVRGGTASAGTTTFNGSAGARTFGGRMASELICEEIMI